MSDRTVTVPVEWMALSVQVHDAYRAPGVFQYTTAGMADALQTVFEPLLAEQVAEIELLKAELDRGYGESARLYEKIEKLRGAGVRRDDEGGQS